MKAILLSLVLCSTANALVVEYNEKTGNVTFRDITESTEQVVFWWPTKYAASQNYSEMSKIMPTSGRSSYDNTTYNNGARYTMSVVKWVRPLGFDDDFDLGNIMLPGIEERFEDKFSQNFVDAFGFGNWSAGGVVDYGKGYYYPVTRVPEPATLWVLASALVCWCCLRIIRM